MTISEAFWNVLRRVPDVGTWKITPSQRRYRLDRMRRLLARVGNPQEAYTTIHVAGTKGKGSTAAFLAHGLGATGRRTGLYTSPHVSDPAERMTLLPASDGMPIPMHAELVADCVAGIEAALAAMPPATLPGGFPWTAFELVTAFALLYFKRVGCEFAVIETGIGGRYDATNVITPAASVITPIDLDHTDLLGDTIAAIAWEKSGIIKPTIPVFSAAQPPEAAAVLRRTSQERNARIRFLDEDLCAFEARSHRAGTDVALHLRGLESQRFRLRLLGQFQARNAALAYLTLRQTFPQFPCRPILNGFERAFLPGRLELVSETPPILLDGAHTPLAIRAILRACLPLFPAPRILIFGAISGKAIAEMARLLSPHFQHIIISTPGAFKASDPEHTHAIFQREHASIFLDYAPEQALRHALELAHHSRLILGTGSFFMVAELRKLLLPDAPAVFR